MKTTLTVIFILAVQSAGLYAQSISWVPAPKFPFITSTDTLSFQQTAPDLRTPSFLPKHAKENPSGYSYLCRLELKLEDRLPLGVWVKLGASPGLRTSSGGQANLRLKLLRF